MSEHTAEKLREIAAKIESDTLESYEMEHFIHTGTYDNHELTLEWSEKYE